MITLSPRLAMVAGLTREGNVLTDIGTDHAYLPATLILEGRIPSAIAADVRKGPLSNAEETIRKYGLEEQITTVLSDGFAALTPGVSHDFVLAGMGGNLITDLMAAADWIQEPGNHFVLQPQSHAEDLRQYLSENGFTILRETAVEEPRHVYLAMEVEYTGIREQLTPSQYYIGKLKDADCPAKYTYYNMVTDRLIKRLDALLQVEGAKEECDLLTQIITDIKETTHGT